MVRQHMKQGMVSSWKRDDCVGNRQEEESEKERERGNTAGSRCHRYIFEKYVFELQVNKRSWSWQELI